MRLGAVDCRGRAMRVAQDPIVIGGGREAAGRAGCGRCDKRAQGFEPKPDRRAVVAVGRRTQRTGPEGGRAVREPHKGRRDARGFMSCRKSVESWVGQ